jgi:nitrogen regulatory protein P-II 1
MKMVVAVIRSEQLPAVKDALFEAGFRNLTATAVMGTAPKTEQQMFRGVRREVTLFRRVRLEVVVTDAVVEEAIRAITRGAKDTGGWGRIFVTEVHEVVNIWTDERGPEAL